jgi:C4-dicarboxylate transporter DctM subunit
MLETILTLGIIALAFVGTPLFVIMALISLVCFSMCDIATSSVAIAIYQIAEQPTLLTIPLFTFSGYLMAESKSPERILRLAQASMGWIPGGVAIMGLIVCAFFTAFTGASGVTIIALGGLLFPILRSEGFDERFTLGFCTASGAVGLLFPPSLPLILYGLVAKVDIDTLFKAGAVPGLLLIVVMVLYAVKKGKKKEKAAAFSKTELMAAFKGSFWEILLPIGVLVGIYGGFTTVTEAAAMTAGYVLLMECVFYRDIKFEQIKKIVKSCMSLVGAILLILCCALALTDFLIDKEVPMKLLDLMRKFITHKYTFLMTLNIFLLIVGCMMDIFSAIIVVVPLIIPIASEYGVHPIHLAIIFLTNLEIGYLTPPVGINLFISSFRFQKPITEIYQATWPFLLLRLVTLLAITYIPFLSLMWV